MPVRPSRTACQLGGKCEMLPRFPTRNHLMAMRATPAPPQLKRQIGVFAATLLGLGSILGTGVFVSLAIATGATGPAVLLAVVIAAGVATCNGLSSAQLAAAHPVSGGTYEYGYRWLHPRLGFTAGWMFLCAKSASAATAALGFAGYLLHSIDGPVAWAVPLAVGTVVLMTVLTLTGLKRSTLANTVIVGTTLLSLVAFILAGLPMLLGPSAKSFEPFFEPVDVGKAPTAGFLEACALMFVAYTGYGRIATLGEEIEQPQRNIPLAIIWTLVLSMLLYMGVAVVAIGTTGATELASMVQGDAAPLVLVAHQFSTPGVSLLVSIGAMTAMLGVLLNLILGLSRVVLAMGRRGDLPTLFSRLDAAQSTPTAAVLLVGLIIAGLACVGSVRTTWSFSAFTVLIYYALTNLSALRLNPGERLYSPLFAWGGLASCLFLAGWVEPIIWQAGLALIVLGLVVQMMMRRSVRVS